MLLVVAVMRRVNGCSFAYSFTPVKRLPVM